MNRLGTIAVCLAGALALNAGTRAGAAMSAGNPYEPIVERNVFGLNPPSSSTEDTNKANENLSKITPNGIMSIFGQLQVLFKVAPKPGQKDAKEASFVLSEGQAQDGIEVVRIDEKAALVTFNNNGTVQEIPLANAPKISAPASAGGAGGGPSQNFPAAGRIPPRFGGSPGVNPGVNPGVISGGGSGRGRTGLFGGQNRDNPNPGNAPAFGAASTRANSGFSMTQPNDSGASSGTQTQRPLTAEEQKVMIEVMKAKYESEGNPISQIMP
jgi:hypothetical protein